MSNTMKNVVITGASSGFGAGAVKTFADQDYRVWGTMRNTDGRNAAKKADLEAYADTILSVFPGNFGDFVCPRTFIS